MLRLLFIVGQYFFLLLTFIACKNDLIQTESYVSVYKKDTAFIELSRSNADFFGKYKIISPGNVIDSGDIRGKIIKDTLTGDFYYHSYGWSQKQRKPFAVLQKGNNLILGTGVHYEYFGIPYYKPGTHNFDKITFVFKRVNQ